MKVNINKKDIWKAKIMGITPFISLIAFFLLGLIWDLWNPGWLVFFLIPLMALILGYIKFKFSYPILCVLIYILLGLIFGSQGWTIGWVVFLTIPIYYILFSKDSIKVEEDKDVEIIINDK